MSLEKPYLLAEGVPDVGAVVGIAGAVAEYRNCIAHSDRMDKVDPLKMWHLDLTLNALLRLVFLRELGWDEDRCHSAAMRHNMSWIN
ncbi:MAG: HEPN domain-containing protein [Actinophytocola sp.]|uniref:HEPN domain-containing protein n=1 Tax=Actinophytocola sp. TaxID=1872138 RepID=UPI003C70D873